MALDTLCPAARGVSSTPGSRADVNTGDTPPAVGLGLFFYQTSLLIKKTEPFFSLTGSVNASYGQDTEIVPNHKHHG